MATHSSVLAWRFPGTMGPGGLPSMGLHRVGHDWSDLAGAAASRVGKIPLVPWCSHSHQDEGGSLIIPVLSLTKQSRVSFRVTLRWFGCLHPSNRFCSIHHYLTVESIQQGDTEMQQVNQEERYDNKSENLLQTDLHQICKSYSSDKGLIWYTKISFKTTVKNRKYSDNYIQFRFSFIENNDSPHLQCVICREVLANISWKPFLVAYGLEQQLYVF